jgi:Ca2+-transporting ATPase
MTNPLLALHTDNPWTHSWQEALKALNVSADKGLAASEVRRRRRRCGSNRLRDIQSKSAWQILVEQFKSLIVLLLVVATAL